MLPGYGGGAHPFKHNAMSVWPKLWKQKTAIEAEAAETVVLTATIAAREEEPTITIVLPALNPYLPAPTHPPTQHTRHTH